MKVDALEADREHLRRERDRFAAQAQAANDKRRAAAADFKRSVDWSQRQISCHEDTVEPAEVILGTGESCFAVHINILMIFLAAASGAPRKRRRTVEEELENTTTRHRRRILHRPCLRTDPADEESTIPLYELRRSLPGVRCPSVESDSDSFW